MESPASGKAELRQLNRCPRYLAAKIASYEFNFLLVRASDFFVKQVSRQVSWKRETATEGSPFLTRKAGQEVIFHFCNSV